MTNSRASGGVVKLESYESAGAEADHTFSGTWTPDAYSKLTVVVQGEPTATFDLQMVVNGLESTLNTTHGQLINNTAIAYFTSAGVAFCLIGKNMTTDRNMYATIDIYVNDIGALDIVAMSQSMNMQGGEGRLAYHQIVATASSITTIKIQTSTSTWKVGTKITLYGHRR